MMTRVLILTGWYQSNNNTYYESPDALQRKHPYMLLAHSQSHIAVFKCEMSHHQQI